MRGQVLGVQLYCPSGYHCCSKIDSTCCSVGFICGGTVCISIAAIVIPCIIVVVIIVVVIVIIIKKKKAHQGVVIVQVIHKRLPTLRLVNTPRQVNIPVSILPLLLNINSSQNKHASD
ncbi:uncharacterized protein LOC134238692 [Saccostrea cucullata]|uniref:uncharacterized protein LOC134238692 n=1 Tax=Saccostrea cuccullata TaxID=36930 RepID=UPI002ED320B1